MDAMQIVACAKLAGLRITLSEDGKVQVFGRGADYERWLPVLKEHKAQIIPVLEQAPAPIPYKEPYLIQWLDSEKGCTSLIPYTKTEWFITELGKAREFLRGIYLRGIDTVVLADNSLDLVPCRKDKPRQRDWDLAKEYQHGIRAHLLGEPFNLFSPESYKG